MELRDEFYVRRVPACFSSEVAMFVPTAKPACDALVRDRFLQSGQRRGAGYRAGAVPAREELNPSHLAAAAASCTLAALRNEEDKTDRIDYRTVARRIAEAETEAEYAAARALLDFYYRFGQRESNAHRMAVLRSELLRVVREPS